MRNAMNGFIAHISRRQKHQFYLMEWFRFCFFFFAECRLIIISSSRSSSRRRCHIIIINIITSRDFNNSNINNKTNTFRITITTKMPPPPSRCPACSPNPHRPAILRHRCSPKRILATLVPPPRSRPNTSIHLRHRVLTTITNSRTSIGSHTTPSVRRRCRVAPICSTSTSMRTRPPWWCHCKNPTRNPVW